MTPEEINLMIAELEGRSAKFMSVNGVTYDQRCEQFPKDYFGSNAAMDLLGVLESQGYWWEMGNCENGDKFIKIGSWYGGLIVTAQRPAISAAICTAIIELIEREGK